MVLCGMECVHLKNNTIKILGVYFSYNRSLENDENYGRYIIKIEKLLKLWRMRQLTIEGKISIYKTLVISKVVHLASVKVHHPVQLLKQKKYKNNLFGKTKS